jgi:hypothetical protein
MLKVGMGSSGGVEMIEPAVTVEDEDDVDDGKLIVWTGCMELDDIVSNVFRSSMMVGCRFSNSQCATKDSCRDALVWELNVFSGGRRGADPEGGVPAEVLGLTTRVCPLSRSSSSMTSAGSFRFSTAALACLRKLLTVT